MLELIKNIDLSELNTITVFVRLTLAALMGGLIGLERGISGHQAGMRTYMLVCVGATIVMCTNIFMAGEYDITDPTRMGAQVVSGIGFLGVGTIIVTKNQRVTGLTTAAGLWVSGCLGLAIGSGFYSASIFSIVLIFFITTALRRVEDRILLRSKGIDVYVELDEGRTLKELMDTINKNDYIVIHIQVIPSKFGNENELAAQISLRLPKLMMHSEVIEILQSDESVRYIEEI